MPSQSAYLLDQLKRSLPLFDETSAEHKLLLLRNCAAIKLNNPRTILDYHNCLLFVLGYCESEDLYLLAVSEMERLAAAVKKLPGWQRGRLDRSGVVYSATQGAYSLSLIKWLLKTFPGQAALHSFDEGGTHPKEVLKPALPEMEFELLADEKLNAVKWLQRASGLKKKSDLLAWLVKHVDLIKAPDAIKDQLFESMSLFVNIGPKNKLFSKGFGNFFLHENYYHKNGLLKRFDEKALIGKKLPPAQKLSDFEKNTIIEKARVALALLNRETDPITYCNADGLLLYELEHGLSIALFSMLPGRRLPMESYIGFMMFKNGYPMAYGGGWLFGRRSLLGINIFEAFRGGESAFVFCQLLRTYRQSFGADYFEVEPYQFGKDNPEGLQSGAFWFYYRFGFRPVDKELNALALKEAELIKENKGYRSSIETLKQFTRSNIAVNFKNDSTPLNPSAISKFITGKIASGFNGDRAAAEKWCRKKLKDDLGIKTNSPGLEKLSLFAGLCLDTKKLPASTKNKLKEFIIEKGYSEFKYIALCSELNFENLLTAEVKKALG